jgi:hypothetical protein
VLTKIPFTLAISTPRGPPRPAGYAPVGGRVGMAEQQPADSSGGDGQTGHGPEVTRVGGVLLGLGLIIGAVNQQPVKLSNQVLPELPATGVLALRWLIGLVGALPLVWGLDGLLGRPLPRAGA